MGTTARTKVGSFLEHGGLGKAGDIQVTYGMQAVHQDSFIVQKASKKGKRYDEQSPNCQTNKKLMEYLVRLITPN